MYGWATFPCQSGMPSHRQHRGMFAWLQQGLHTWSGHKRWVKNLRHILCSSHLCMVDWCQESHSFGSFRIMNREASHLIPFLESVKGSCFGVVKVGPASNSIALKHASLHLNSSKSALVTKSSWQWVYPWPCNGSQATLSIIIIMQWL